MGRGATLGTASEAALKLKEVAGMQAEPFSFAEVAHGPMTLVGPDMPVLALGPEDEAREGLWARAGEFTARGAFVAAAGEANDVASASLVLAEPQVSAALRPLTQIMSFYRVVGALARARGRDPDKPPHLRKVTKTL